MIPPIHLGSASWEFADAKPFPHARILQFFEPAFAREISAEFPPFHSTAWHEYANALEVKRTCNSWNAFGPATYRALTWLNSPDFVELLSLTLGVKLYADPGLHGGGLHLHAAGGKLNVHKDYVLHPKTRLQRRINLLVYLNEDWQEAWGGALGLWEANPVQQGPGALVKSYAPDWNSAVLFDTRDAWHGLPKPIQCPPGQYRKSLAVYYLAQPEEGCEQRSRALFAPAPEQVGDAEVLDLIARRADEATAATSYRTHAPAARLPTRGP